MRRSGWLTSRDLPWLIAPMPVIGAGILVASFAGVRPTAYTSAIAAVVLGRLCFSAFVSTSPEARRRIVEGGLFAVPAAIAATLAFTGMDGVKRWIPLGPLRLHAAAALTPWLLAAIEARLPRSPLVALAALTATLLIHVAQPDAGQATALAAGAALLLARDRQLNAALRIGALSGAAALVAAAWMRADPLAALDHVERILVIGLQSGPLGAAITAGAWLAMLSLAWRGARALGEDRRPLALGFAGYWAAMIAVTFVGRFPVPWMGASAAPVLGWYLMTALLRAPGAEGAPR